MLLDFSRYTLHEIIDQISRSKMREEFSESIVQFLHKWNDKEALFSIHTSGSTGDPKELVFSKKSLTSSALISLNTFHLSKGDLAFLCLPLNFVAGKLMLVRAIVGKLKLRIANPSSNPLSNVSEKIDFAAFTPFQVANIIEQNKERLDRISTIILGGSSVSAELEKKLKECTSTIYETFGMSETLTHCAIRNISKGAKNFQVLEGFSCKKNDEGCLEISAEHLPHSPIITNDLVELINKDQFLWLGRKDNVINTGGVKIYPENIERKIASFFPFPLIVAKQKDAKLGEKAILYILERDKADFDSSIFDSISFHKYEKPKEIRFIMDFPRNSNGKIDRKLLND